MTDHLRLPPELRRPTALAPETARVRKLLRACAVHTVCQEARCPNIAECFQKSTATFMILGRHCTRNCRFCAVESACPDPVDPGEPERIAKAAGELHLKHVVLTMVTRDDLQDGGASHIAACIRALEQALPQAHTEALISDLQGNPEALQTVIQTSLAVFNHNVETVPRLYPTVRPEADYARSLQVLQFAAEAGRQAIKSGFMVGLGETEEEVVALLQDLRSAGVQMVTIGQYLRPSLAHLPVVEYVSAEQFARYRQIGLSLGFHAVFSGPLVRSSYRAAEAYLQQSPIFITPSQP